MKGYYLRFYYLEQITPHLKKAGSFELVYLPCLLTTVSPTLVQGATNIFHREAFNRRIGRHPYNRNKDIAYAFEEKYYMLFPLVDLHEETVKRRTHRWIMERLRKAITPYWRGKFEISQVNSIEDLKTLVKSDQTMENIVFQDQMELEVPRFLEIVAAV